MENNYWSSRGVDLLMNYCNFVRFQVLTAASTKMAVFWDVAPCSLVEVYRLFRGACCLHHQDDRPLHTVIVHVKFV
jgi:hypothetical protein